jgi:hypothetical protein
LAAAQFASPPEEGTVERDKFHALATNLRQDLGLFINEGRGHASMSKIWEHLGSRARDAFDYEDVVLMSTYGQIVSQPGVWAHAAEIELLAHALQMRIAVYLRDLSRHAAIRIVNPVFGPPNAQFGVALYNPRNDHFEALQLFESSNPAELDVDMVDTGGGMREVVVDGTFASAVAVSAKLNRKPSLGSPAQLRALLDAAGCRQGPQIVDTARRLGIVVDLFKPLSCGYECDVNGARGAIPLVARWHEGKLRFNALIV